MIFLYFIMFSLSNYEALPFPFTYTKLSFQACLLIKLHTNAYGKDMKKHRFLKVRMMNSDSYVYFDLEGPRDIDALKQKENIFCKIH